ncbi:class I SAM-dependent methyltransferase [Ornithinibacillus sp. 179-J 7C1 HS]|uniref:class I SAM-dependent methyltransferase n=1 Tax=Ornithinibacillus sp. 179-J 7C1 HS TaxID=3142384 RepID=UPI00399F7222
MGREFLEIFEEWANDYDKTVNGQDPEYIEVFRHYDQILDEVVNNSVGTVLEFGVGTGNLTKKIMDKGHHVIGIEPSPAMREIAKVKLPKLSIQDGDFLNFPVPDNQVNTIVSSYAFHHLNDQEKEEAIKKLAKLLPKGGKIVFADTLFVSDLARQRKIKEALDSGFLALAEDLRREYYPNLETIERIFSDNNFNVSFKQMNEFVWLIIATYK